MKILCEYNVNIDSVYRISGAEISELLNAFEKTEILQKINNPPGKIVSESDFVAGLAYCMKNGCGAEWLVFEQPVFEFLKNRFFEKSLIRMGGNAGIMANALSQLGASKVIPNVAVPSKTQLSLFSKKAIYFPGTEIEVKTDLNDLKNKSKENSKLEFGKDADINGDPKNPAFRDTFQEDTASKNTISNNQDPIHFVFDFSKGDAFSLYGTEITVPRENRFIATCDHLNFRLFVNPEFERYAFEHIREINGVLVSGFHLLLESYPDGSTYEMILENAFSQLKHWKNKNDKLQVHLEFGHFVSKTLANSVFLKFAALSDSIGMNEDELSIFQHLHGISGEKLVHMDAEAIGEAAFKLASQYKLKKLLIHTREFVITAFMPGQLKSSPEYILNPETNPKSNSKSDPISNFESSLQEIAGKKLEAMEFGVKCAGVYAASGRLEDRESIKNEALKLQESLFGKKQLDFFLKAFNGKTQEDGAYAFKEGFVLCMIPTLLSKTPTTTVGLGDTLTAGTFLRGLELDVQAQT